jgi:hypothetical protein
MQRKAYAMPVSVPSLERLRSADLFIPLILGLAFVLPLMLAFMGVGMRRNLDRALVINEVFVTPKNTQRAPYIKLFNNTNEPISISGMKLSTAQGDVVTLEGVVPEKASLQIKVPNAWSAQGDAVILRGLDGNQLDDVHWGAAPQTNPIPGWSKNAVRIAPDTALVRNPQGFDSDSRKDWGPPVEPSKKAQSPASLSTGMYRLLFDITNYVSLIAGFLLWGSFILIGLIAKRFEMLTGQRSFWTAMVVAPIGIVIYNSIQSYAFFTAGIMSDCKQGFAFSACQQGWAFVPLFFSALAMAYVVYRFYGIARRILEV